VLAAKGDVGDVDASTDADEVFLRWCDWEVLTFAMSFIAAAGQVSR
jgi:hypothetical protein